MRTTKGICLGMADQATKNYREDGHVKPMMTMVDVDDDEIIMGVNPEGSGENMQDTVAKAMLAFGVFLGDLRRVVLVVEGWMKPLIAPEGVDPEEWANAEENRLARGELQRQVDAGATDIHTAVIVMAHDCLDEANSCVFTLDMDDETAEPHVHEGPIEGGLGDILRSVATVLPEAKASFPEFLTFPTVVNLMGRLIGAVATNKLSLKETLEGHPNAKELTFDEEGDDERIS